MAGTTKQRTFYKVSFWLCGIITNDEAYCYYEATSEEDAFMQFKYLHGHINVRNLTIKRVRRNSHTYNLLCSVYKND